MRESELSETKWFNICPTQKEGVMKSRALSMSVMLLVFCMCLTLLTQAGLAGARSAERAADKGRIVIQPGKDGTNTIVLRCMEGKCPTCPLQLTPGKYGLMVTGIERKGVQVVVAELKNERGKEVFRGEPDSELGPINLKEGVSYGVYIGKKDVSSAKSADCLIATVRIIPCPPGCIRVCGGPCPPGYYYKGLCGYCDGSMGVLCCCRVP